MEDRLDNDSSNERVTRSTRSSLTAPRKSIDDDNSNSSDDPSSKHLRMLQFRNPGKFMEDFDPETSAREMRKMNRRIYRENRRKNQAYDETGVLTENSQDLCDCLDLHCPGCHFPCPKCGSEKCGSECRCNRKWVYEYVEVEGTNMILKWPEQKTNT